MATALVEQKKPDEMTVDKTVVDEKVVDKTGVDELGINLLKLFDKKAEGALLQM